MKLVLDWSRGIDVCQSNGNLLASGGHDKHIKIFDKREPKIVKTFEGDHSGKNSISFVLSFTTEIVSVAKQA